MTPSLAIDVVRQTLWTTFWLALPLLMIGLVVGVLVSLIQVATSIQDSSFGTVPRLSAFFFALLLLLPWLTTRLIAFTTTLFGDFSRYAR